MDNPTRIAELEQALGEVIAYLRKLPPHTQTYHHANAAEAVLNRKSPYPLQGGKWFPAGVLACAAQLEGTTLTIKTRSLDHQPKIKEWFLPSIYQSLTRGVQLQLGAPSNDFDGFFRIEAPEHGLDRDIEGNFRTDKS